MISISVPFSIPNESNCPSSISPESTSANLNYSVSIDCSPPFIDPPCNLILRSREAALPQVALLPQVNGDIDNTPPKPHGRHAHFMKAFSQAFPPCPPPRTSPPPSPSPPPSSLHVVSRITPAHSHLSNREDPFCRWQDAHLRSGQENTRPTAQDLDANGRSALSEHKSPLPS